MKTENEAVEINGWGENLKHARMLKVYVHVHVFYSQEGMKKKSFFLHTYTFEISGKTCRRHFASVTIWMLHVIDFHVYSRKNFYQYSVYV
jgi:hypothetical protein